MVLSLAIVLYAVDPAEQARVCRRARELTACDVHVEVVARGATDSPGRLRNRALRASDARFAVFWGDPASLESSFVAHALRTLERDPTVSFVASWLDGMPRIADRPAKKLGVESLLARPWFLHVPTLFRREIWEMIGGFDEKLGALEDLDFWLRAIAAGAKGLAIEEPNVAGPPWGPSLAFDAENARAEAERVFERHRTLFETHVTDVVLGKERALRELFLLRARAEARAAELRREVRRLKAVLAAAEDLRRE